MSQDGSFVTFDLDLLLKGKQCFALYASVSFIVAGYFLLCTLSRLINVKLTNKTTSTEK